MSIHFEWDNQKAAVNVQKHGIEFDEATTVFRDNFSLTIADPDHSNDVEERWVILGRSVRERLLVVVHVEVDDLTIRIVSARRATKSEALDYASRL